MNALRREDGFTLTEMLTAIAMAMIICLAAFSLIDATMRRTAETRGRVESSQRGRLAMDTITRQLRSQVCSGADTAITQRAGFVTNTTQVSFYVDFRDPSTLTATSPPPELHVLRYDATKRQIFEDTYVPTAAGAYPAAGSPTKTRAVLDDVVPENAATPIFAYWAYNTASPAALTTLSATAGLSAADRARVARIDIAYKALPTRAAATARGSNVFENEVFVRSTDPNDPAPNPQCA